MVVTVTALVGGMQVGVVDGNLAPSAKFLSVPVVACALELVVTG
jgi:hypothetical protein